ncbi:hypothetical protein NDU88_003133 [Pleurodeles waltl]|uniref:Uncharacterized protein n=1 Tax=Pleurodeles waltl TaxID=8319 RepID=A0AAV7WNI6_PLEWA|nr:hypothetical protein NDU88_003133 [Pleurodeles waltl]
MKQTLKSSVRLEGPKKKKRRDPRWLAREQQETFRQTQLGEPGKLSQCCELDGSVQPPMSQYWGSNVLHLSSGPEGRVTGAARRPSRHRDTLQQVQLVRWQAPERSPTLAPGKLRVYEEYADKMVLFAVEAKEPSGCEEAHLRKGVYVLYTGVGMDEESQQSVSLATAEVKHYQTATVERNKQEKDRTGQRGQGRRQG